VGGGKGGGANTLENSSYIIVETNFRVRDTGLDYGGPGPWSLQASSSAQAWRDELA